MNLGEYLYIYSLAYHSYLGHDPTEGPVILKDTPECFEDRGERMFGDDDSTFGIEKVRRRYRRIMKTMLENQLAALPAAGKMGEVDRWRQTIRDELRRFESDRDRTAWEDGLPEAALSSLAPFRDRFERDYSAATNCFEMPLGDDEDWTQWVK
jgi:hypothetical protein